MENRVHPSEAAWTRNKILKQAGWVSAETQNWWMQSQFATYLLWWKPETDSKHKNRNVRVFRMNPVKWYGLTTPDAWSIIQQSRYVRRLLSWILHIFRDPESLKLFTQHKHEKPILGSILCFTHHMSFIWTFYQRQQRRIGNIWSEVTLMEFSNLNPVILIQLDIIIDRYPQMSPNLLYHQHISQTLVHSIQNSR